MAICWYLFIVFIYLFVYSYMQVQRKGLYLLRWSWGKLALLSGPHEEWSDLHQPQSPHTSVIKWGSILPPLEVWCEGMHIVVWVYVDALSQLPISNRDVTWYIHRLFYYFVSFSRRQRIRIQMLWFQQYGVGWFWLRNII